MRVCVDRTANLRCAIREWLATNWNLSVFCANTKRTGCARCPFHVPGVLCSPQVHGKLINRVPLTRRMRTEQRSSGVLVYTKLYKNAYFSWFHPRQQPSAYRRCHEKTSYVSNYAFLTLLHKWVDRRQMHRSEKLQ